VSRRAFVVVADARGARALPDAADYGDAGANRLAHVAETVGGLDSTTGHWELMGAIAPAPLPAYPAGFPAEVVAALEQATGRRLLCNRPYKGCR